MNHEWTEALADLYADGALSEELKATVDAVALSDARLAHDLHTLGVIRSTLAGLPAPAFDLDTEQRIRAKIEAEAGDIETTYLGPSNPSNATKTKSPTRGRIVAKPGIGAMPMILSLKSKNSPPTGLSLKV